MQNPTVRTRMHEVIQPMWRDKLYFYLSLIWLAAIVGTLVFGLLA